MRYKSILAVGLLTTLLGCNQQNKGTEPEQQASQSLDSLANTLVDRWQLNDGTLRWQVKDVHQDHIEMSGEQISAIVHYGSDVHGNLTLNRKLVWPMLRTMPNDTHASLIHDLPLSVSPKITVDGEIIANEKLQQVALNGTLNLQSMIDNKLELTRTLSPSTTLPVLIEQLTFNNVSQLPIDIAVEDFSYQHKTDADKGVYGSYTISANAEFSGTVTIQPEQSFTTYVHYQGIKDGQAFNIDGLAELKRRQQYVEQLGQKLQFKSPDPVLNVMFEFAKLRAAESIYRTKGGLMHGPGGGRYYAAIWANDQAEYINPFFPFLGDDNGNESAINSFNTFARYMNDDFKPIPSSIIAEGTDYWNGAGDRGDCAMIAYGASRFALANSSPEQARQLLPLIDWCIEFSFRQQTKDGVIASDSDELEGRFPSGKVNLSTNMLTYGALVSSAYLNRELDRIEIAKRYEHKAEQLKQDMTNYFAANVQGFETYRYFDGNTKLRAWIALPFTMGIFERKQGTLDAIFSPHLWNENGIYSEAGNKTFWDRATLYAFRGIFAAGETDTAMQYFKFYSRKRLLGEHVPYAVEAWPEGDQRHLSAESALYARVVTEGIFGIEPTGFNRFKLAPYLPTGWNNMCLNAIQAFGQPFDICVSRDGKKHLITISREHHPELTMHWDGKQALEVSL